MDTPAAPWCRRNDAYAASVREALITALARRGSRMRTSSARGLAGAVSTTPERGRPPGPRYPRLTSRVRRLVLRLADKVSIPQTVRSDVVTGLPAWTGLEPVSVETDLPKF